MRSLKNMIDLCQSKTSSMALGGKSYKEPKVKFGKKDEAGSSKGASSSTGKTKMHFWSPGGNERD